MKFTNGLAMWHYPHRTVTENISFFAGQDIDVLGLNQSQVVREALSSDEGVALANALIKENMRVTVHGAMTMSHNKEDVDDFKKRISLVGDWQRKYRLIDIISFDVSDKIRDNVCPYVDYVMENVPDCKVALEDFGLNEKELQQIDHLKNNDRFGYLVDVGHMYMRLAGKSESPHTLFQNSKTEGGKSEVQGYNEFLTAFKSKTFPIYEIHLHNNDGIRDMHYFLEDGTLDMEMIAKVLETLDYNGVVTIESAPGFMFECKGKDADEGIIKTINYWNRILKG